MGKAVVNLSEEMRFYFSDKANHSAIKQVLGGPGEEFSWDELDQFYDAWLSAQKVRVAYWRFMRKAWERIWGDAIRQSSLQDMNFWDYEMEGSWYGGENFLDSVWNYGGELGCIYGGFGSREDDNNEWEILLGIYDSNPHLSLWFWFWRKDGYVLNMDIEGDWLPDWQESWDEEKKGEYITSKSSNVNLVPLGEDKTEIDISRLHEQASHAVNKLSEELKSEL